MLIMRNEDLDQGRAKPEFVSAFLEDLRCEDRSWGRAYALISFPSPFVSQSL